MLISPYAYADAHGRVKNKHLSDGQRGVLRVRLVPYGKWICADDREVLFDRNYGPIYERRPGHAANVADPAERVPWVEQSWFYNDDTSQVHRLIRGRTVLVSWGVLNDFGQRLTAITDEELYETYCPNMPRRFPGPICAFGKR